MRVNSLLRFMFFSAVLISLVLTVPLSSSASDTKWYIGLGFGLSEIDTGVSNLNGTADLDDEDNGFKIFAGYQFCPYFGVEVGFIDLGEAELKGNTGDTFDLKGTTYIFLANNVTLNTEVRSIPVFAVFSLPLDKPTGVEFLKHFTPFAKVGFHYWEADLTVAAGNLNRVTTDDDGTDFAFGLGLNVNFTDHIAIRGEWERLYEDEEADFFSGSLIIKF